MIKKVFWNKRAVRSLRTTFDYIDGINPRKADEFINKVDTLVEMLSTFPEIGRRSMKYKTIRQCKVDKHRKMYYRRDKNTLIIVLFQDDRQNPSSNPY